jgi:hypothetical protein
MWLALASHHGPRPLLADFHARVASHPALAAVYYVSPDLSIDAIPGSAVCDESIHPNPSARRHVVTRKQCCFNAWPMLLPPCLEVGHGESVDSCRSPVPHDPLIPSPQVITFHYGVHLPQCFRFRLPIRRRANIWTS